MLSASDMLVSDDEGAVSPIEMSRKRGWRYTLLVMAGCVISVRYQKNLQPLQGSFSVDDTGPRQDMWHSHCLLNAPEVLQEPDHSEPLRYSIFSPTDVLLDSL